MVLLGKWTTKFTPGVSNGNGANIRVPAQRINDTVLKPGEEFNFIYAAGPFKSPPYELGGAIRGGQIVEDAVIGGGLCTASTTLFNAAMRAGLKIVERHAHNLYISRYPVGLDATIWGSGKVGQNMVFVNDTNHPILIKGIAGRRRVTFEIWGVDDGRTVALSEPVVENLKKGVKMVEYTDELAPGEYDVVNAPYDAFTSSVTRTVRDRLGNVVHRDTWGSKYKLLDGTILIGRYPEDPPAGTRIPAKDYPH